MKSFNDLLKQSKLKKEDQNSMINSLIEAEKTLIKLSFVKQFREKVKLLIFLSTWENSLKVIVTAFESLNRTTGTK